MFERRALRVLVVDNYRDAADSLALVVRLWGYDTEVCYDGSSALETATAYLPHVVLLDIGLPEMDGFQVALALRYRCELIPLTIIGITGYEQKSYRLRALANGFDRYLLKPTHLDGLQELLNQASEQVEDASYWDTNQLIGAVS